VEKDEGIENFRTATMMLQCDSSGEGTRSQLSG
jgi:hypothetical protein